MPVTAPGARVVQVFVEYLTGVVSDETLAEDERREALTGILSSAVEDVRAIPSLWGARARERRALMAWARRCTAQGAESLAETLLSKWSQLQDTGAEEADVAATGGDEAAAMSLKALMADEDAALQEAQRKREAASSAGCAGCPAAAGALGGARGRRGGVGVAPAARALTVAVVRQGHERFPEAASHRGVRHRGERDPGRAGQRH